MLDLLVTYVLQPTRTCCVNYILTQIIIKKFIHENLCGESGQ